VPTRSPQPGPTSLAILLGTPSHEIAMADLLGSCAATHNVHLVMSNYPDISRTRRRWRTGCG
jgi:hypothetical protein